MAKRVTITTAGKLALALFDGKAGQRVAFRYQAVSGSPGGAYLLRPDGTPIASPYVDGWYEPFTLPDDGAYTVVVDPWDANTGAIDVTAYDVPADIVRTITPSAAAPPRR